MVTSELRSGSQKPSLEICGYFAAVTAGPWRDIHYALCEDCDLLCGLGGCRRAFSDRRCVAVFLTPQRLPYLRTGHFLFPPANHNRRDAVADQVRDCPAFAHETIDSDQQRERCNWDCRY